ncbi:MAG TPA: hypothetical protein VFL99_04675 [Segeticoccus sp.]|uniref:hypothetical protein n=1 Tax=Segeticoccus sp. TaxID=2706531 RepID=UPI002D802737|nr:hypothetical protein [Segeticoccus sp.]HET8599599.1 hypothetical protein [Segeticoccus sp.]
MAAASDPEVVLLPSPLLGPAVWRPVAEVLRSRGRPVTESTAPTAAPRTPADVLQGLLAGIPQDRPSVLVPHSNAGYFVPGLATRRDVVAVVYVDAGVAPALGEAALAAPELLEQLEALAGPDGLLPPWTAWWDAHEVDALFPDLASRHAVEAEQRRLPLAYFRSHVAVPAGWDVGLRSAYLSFGEAYADQLARARRSGWPSRRLDGAGHLHMLVDPGGVADEIERLLLLTQRSD